MQDSNSLSGAWGGKYWYPDEREDPVPFTAWLILTDGALNGTALEPNTIFFDGPDELSSELVGSVFAGDVRFFKSYLSVEQEAVVYEGAIADNGTKISGTWRFKSLPGYLGGFEMTRVKAKSEAKLRVAETVR